MNYKTKNILTLSVFIIYIVLVIGVAPMFVGFGPSGGFEKEEILKKFMFYLGIAIFSAVGIVAVYVYALHHFKEGDEEITPFLIHNPERGIFKNIKLIKNPITLIFLSIFVFSILGVLSTLTQTFFSEIPKIEQKFTKTADVFFSAYPASPSETLGLGFLVMLVMLIVGYYFKKHNINKRNFIFIIIPLILIISIFYGVINHTLRYSDSDIKLLTVAGFWGIQGVLIIIFGSVIPSFIMHDVNNIFYKLNKLFSSDLVVSVTVSVLILLFVIFLTYILIRRGRRKNEK